MAGESHVRKEVLTRRCHHRSKHCEITAAPAAQPPDFAVGTYGGVLTAARKHSSTEAIARDTPQDGWAMSAEHDLAGRTVRLRGVDVLVLGGYAKDGGYHRLAAAVARITRNGKLPCIWLADFNAPPDELRDAAWLERPDANVTREASVMHHVGRGALIDYDIASPCLAPFIDA